MPKRFDLREDRAKAGGGLEAFRRRSRENEWERLSDVPEILGQDFSPPSEIVSGA